MSESGAVSVNIEWETGERERMFIEQQRYGADLIAAGLNRRDRVLLRQGILVINWGVQQQAQDGSFPQCADAVHSTSLFLEALTRAVRTIDAKPSHGRICDQLGYDRDAWVSSAVRMSHWLIKADGETAKKDLYPFSHRYFLRAVGLQRTSLLSKSNKQPFATEARKYAHYGVKSQRADGVLPERDGFDISYQALGMKYASQYTALAPGSGLRSKIANMFQHAVPLFQSRINEGGEVDLDDSTRSAETGRSGRPKRFDRFNAMLAFTSGYQLTGDVAYRMLVQRLLRTRKQVSR